MEYKIDELIIKHLSGTLSDEERVILDEWKALPDNHLLLEQLSDKEWVRRELRKMTGLKEENAYNKLSQIYARQTTPEQTPVLRLRRSWYLVAAVLILVAGAGGWFLFTRNGSGKAAPEALATSENRFKNDVQPGGNRATLILDDSSVVILDSAATGLLSRQGNTQVVKLDDGRIAYQNAGRSDQRAIPYNTIKTPRGGQYMVLLPDGSKAWLNSASSLRFPAVFAGNERIVELQGEGYFEVSTYRGAQGAGDKQPFIVKAGDIRVQVLGTHFNVSAYTDEDAIKTTLLEGSVKVSRESQEEYLKPGQQAQADRQGALKSVPQADLEQTMAWHNGIFAFRSASIVSIMRQAQRWYDIEVVYEGKVNKDQPLDGDIPRDVVLSQLLKILEATGSVHFRIDGKKVTVTP